MTPRVEQLKLPPDYGKPKRTLPWGEIRTSLETATVYWIATSRPNGRPHVVPRDGIWMDDRLIYGGSPETAHHRIVTKNGAAAAHIGEGLEAVIVEGDVTVEVPSPDLAERMAKASFEKYPQYGQIDPSMYESGVLVLTPSKVIAWVNFPDDATRFLFDRGSIAGGPGARGR